jgi:hypothetical protein
MVTPRHDLAFSITARMGNPLVGRRGNADL